MNSIKLNNGIESEIINGKIYPLLPNTLQSLTKNYEGRERDIVLTSSLGVLSACIPNIFGIYDGDKIYSNCMSSKESVLFLRECFLFQI